MLAPLALGPDGNASAPRSPRRSISFEECPGEGAARRESRSQRRAAGADATARLRPLDAVGPSRLEGRRLGGGRATSCHEIAPRGGARLGEMLSQMLTVKDVERGGQRPLSDRMNSRLTSGLSAPEARCRRTCRRTASLRFPSARRRPIASTVTSHAPQAEQLSCTAASKDRTDAVRPQKRHLVISAALTRLNGSPLLTALGRAGCTAPIRERRQACHAPRGLLKNAAILSRNWPSRSSAAVSAP